MAEPLSFCMVTTFYPPYHFGGEAMYLYRLSNALARRGHDVTVVHCVDSYRLLSSAGPRGSFPHEDNVTVVPIRSRLGRVSPVATYLTGRPVSKSPALDAVFERQRFDVVHFHLVTLFGPGVLTYGGDALKLYTAHDHWLVCPMYDLWKRNRELCEQPECIRCSLSFKRPPQLWRYTSLLERSLAEIDTFLAPSDSTIEQHRRRGFPYPMRRLPYFLPPVPESAEPPRAPAASERPYFLFVGRLVKLKGAQTLIEAFRHYDRADLLIAGDGVYESELRKQARGLDHVRFLGRVHPDELRSLYAGALATLVPSLVYETFGLITLESFSHGTPVIARDLGAVGELVRESGGGLTYRTETELLDALERLRTNHGLRAELAERGRRGHVERWSTDPHLDSYFELIEEARSRRTGRSPAAVGA